MNFLAKYLNKMTENILNMSIKDYRQYLDIKLSSIEKYINYLNLKKQHVNEMIDRLTITLENKYVEFIETMKISFAQEVENIEINNIKQKLNQMEADVARIDATISQQTKEKATAETECDLIEQIYLVA